MTIDRKLYLAKIARFEKWLNGRGMVEARDFQRFVDRKIESLSRQLAAPMDAPSWGPDRNKVLAAANDDNLDGTIDANLVLSERIAKYLPLYVVTTIIGVLIMLGALSVDFLILNEFWTRAMFPDFAQDLAKDFGGSAFAKSLQVVFATIAFHFFLTTLGPRGRKGFIWALFAVALFVIVGLGGLNASVTGPNQAPAPAAEGIGSVLEGLGLPTKSDSSAPSETASLRDRLKQIEGALWILIPSVIFVTVTGIAALCLQLAEANVKNIVRAFDWPQRRKRLEELEEMHIIKDFVDRMVGEPQAYLNQSGDDSGNVVAFPKS